VALVEGSTTIDALRDLKLYIANNRDLTVYPDYLRWLDTSPTTLSAWMLERAAVERERGN
jgi:hypothetical protein